MSDRPCTIGLVTLLTTVLIAPSLFLLVPQKVHAQGEVVSVPTSGVGFTDFTTAVKTTYIAIKDTLIEIHAYTTAVAEVAAYVNAYILQPLAFILSGQMMKVLTASVMNFVIGRANGTGIPQFVVDVRLSLQSISDFQKTAFLRQINLTNSPFATSIARALGVDYNQKTSLAGYWAANLCTLGRGIPTYRPGYLAGTWAQGGVAAWFQLTTQSQNNPYLLYLNSQSRLASVIGPGVGGGTGARLAELGWGNGFMSWCSANDTATQTQNSASSGYQACIAKCDSAQGGYTAACANSCITGFTQSGGIAAGGGIKPGDPCTKEDGTAGTIQTPGSVINGVLDKVLGAQQDRLVQMGDISTQVTGILSDIAVVLNTINLAANILGGNDGNGLLNAGSPGGALTRFSPSTQSATSSGAGYFGVTSSEVYQNAATSEVTAAHNTSTTSAVSNIPQYNGGGSINTNTTTLTDMPGRVQQYRTSWNAIAAVASTTVSALQSVMAVCHVYHGGNSTYENNVQNAISVSVTPILTQTSGIGAITAAALAQYALVQSEASTTPTYSADLQKLNTMAPTASDVSSAQYNATAYGAATASPVGSFTVSGGSLVDQLNLIRNNAQAVQSAYCTANESGGAGS
jgi:hypothetical protein